MIQRQAMIEDDSLDSSRLHLAIAIYRLKREIARILDPIFLPIVKWLAIYVNKKLKKSF